MDNPFSDTPFMCWFDLEELGWTGRFAWWLQYGSAPGDLKKAFAMAGFVLNRDNLN